MKERKTRVTKTEITKTIDEFGVIKEETINETFGISKEPPYVKVYIDDISRLIDLPKGMNRILFQFVKHMGYNNVLMAYKPVKMMIANNLDISYSYVEKCLKEFIKKGVFIRIQRGMYVADPSLFGRGSWEEIKDLMMIIRYNVKDGTRILSSSMSEEMQTRMSLSDEQINKMKKDEEYASKQLTLDFGKDTST